VNGDVGVVNAPGDARHEAPRAAASLETNMKTTPKFLALLLAGTALLSGCNTTTNNAGSDEFRDVQGEGVVPTGQPGPDDESTMEN